MNEVKRAVRVAARMQEELAVALRGLRDPRLAGALVSRVEMTDDLQSARVFVRHLDPPEGELRDRARKDLLRGLESAACRLRRDVGQTLGLRYAPNLKFAYDEAPEAVNRVEELLREIHDEDKDRH